MGLLLPSQPSGWIQTVPGRRGGVLGNICTDSKALSSFAGEKQELPLPERAEPLDNQNTEEKQEKAESKLGGECVSRGVRGQGHPDPPGSLSVGERCLEATVPATVAAGGACPTSGTPGRATRGPESCWHLGPAAPWCRSPGKRETGVKLLRQLGGRGVGRGTWGHLSTSQGKALSAPSPQGLACSVPGVSELELQSPSSG